jgi:hypothetical protein
MKLSKFQFRLRTLMALVLLAAAGSLWAAEVRQVSEWQKAVIRGDAHVSDDTDGDGKVDTVWMRLANGRWEKLDLPRK